MPPGDPAGAIQVARLSHSQAFSSPEGVGSQGDILNCKSRDPEKAPAPPNYSLQSSWPKDPVYSPVGIRTQQGILPPVSPEILEDLSLSSSPTRAALCPQACQPRDPVRDIPVCLEVPKRPYI